MTERILHHRFIGEVKLTENCIELNKNNPDTTSIFVEYNNEIKEVSINLIENYLLEGKL